jgi:hypothetical protein
VSDDLIISGGGSVAVATDALLEQEQHLLFASRELSACVQRLTAIDTLVTRGRLVQADAPLSAVHAERAIDDAAAALHSAAGRAQLLGSALGTAADAYGLVERVVAGLAQQLAAQFAYHLGLVLPAAVLLAIPAGLAASDADAGVLGAAWLAAPASTRRRVTAAWIGANKAVLSEPGFVELVRLTVTSVDDLADGAVGMPQPLAQLLGDEGLGVLGLGTSAAAVVAVARTVGAVRETPVAVTESTTSSTRRSLTWQDRAAKIPQGQSQIRIDRYSQPGRPDRFEVSLGGTIDPSLVATDEPWDMTSNLTAVAHGDAGSYRAVQQAMSLAGIDRSTPVIFNGYSQGGLLAAMLASSGDYDTQGLFTLGAPAGQVEVPHDIPYLAVEHHEDLVPATGGVWKSSDPVIVTRDLFDGPPDTSSVVLPAHELAHYRETAGLIDGSDERRVTDVGDALRGFGDGTVSVETTMYRAERVGASGHHGVSGALPPSGAEGGR